MKVLVLCTGNSGRSQMSEYIIKAKHPEFEVYSAGVKPSGQVNPLTVETMAEIGLDLSAAKPKHTDNYTDMEFDYVFTVCGSARDNCPVFTGKVKTRKHIGFEDPDAAKGTKEERMAFFRKIRDQIKDTFDNFDF